MKNTPVFILLHVIFLYFASVGVNCAFLPEFSSKTSGSEFDSSSEFSVQQSYDLPLNLYALPSSADLSETFVYGSLNINYGATSDKHLSKCAFFESLLNNSFECEISSENDCSYLTTDPASTIDDSLYCARNIINSEPLDPSDGLYVTVQWSVDHRASVFMQLFNRCTPSSYTYPCGILAYGQSVVGPTTIANIHLTGMQNITLPNPFDPSCYQQTSSGSSTTWERNNNCDFATFPSTLFLSAGFMWETDVPTVAYSADFSWYWRYKNQNYTIASQTLLFRFFSLQSFRPSIIGGTIVPNMINPLYNQYDPPSPLIWNKTVFQSDFDQPAWRDLPVLEITDTSNFTIGPCDVTPYDSYPRLEAAYQYILTNVPQAYAGVILKHAGGATFHYTSTASYFPSCMLNGKSATVVAWGSTDRFFVIRLPDTTTGGFESFPQNSDLYLHCTGIAYISSAIPQLVFLQLIPPAAASTVGSVSPYTFLTTRATYVKHIQCGSLSPTTTCVQTSPTTESDSNCGASFFGITAQNNFPYYYSYPFETLRFSGNIHEPLVHGDKTLAHYQQTYRLMFLDNYLARNYNESGQLSNRTFDVPFQIFMGNVPNAKVITAFYTFVSINVTYLEPILSSSSSSLSSSSSAASSSPSTSFLIQSIQNRLNQEEPLQIDPTLPADEMQRILQQQQKERLRRVTAASAIPAPWQTDNNIDDGDFHSLDEASPTYGTVVGYGEFVMIQSDTMSASASTSSQTHTVTFDVKTLNKVSRPVTPQFKVYNSSYALVGHLMYLLLVDIVVEVPSSTPVLSSARIFFHYSQPLQSEQTLTQLDEFRVGFFPQASQSSPSVTSSLEFFVNRVVDDGDIRKIEQHILDYTISTQNVAQIENTAAYSSALSDPTDVGFDLNAEFHNHPAAIATDDSAVNPYALYWKWNATIFHANSTSQYWLRISFSTTQFRFTGAFSPCSINGISAPALISDIPLVSGQTSSVLVFDLRPILAAQGILPHDIDTWDEETMCNAYQSNETVHWIDYLIKCDDIYVTNVSSIYWDSVSAATASTMLKNQVEKVSSSSSDIGWPGLSNTNSTLSILAARTFRHMSPQPSPTLVTFSCRANYVSQLEQVILSSIAQWDATPFDPFRWAFFGASIAIGGLCIFLLVIWFYSSSANRHSQLIHRSKATKQKKVTKEIQLAFVESPKNELQGSELDNPRISSSSSNNVYTLLK